MDPRPLIDAIRDRKLRVGVVGLGYVGLPLVRAFVERGFRVLGFDIDRAKVEALAAGRSYIGHLSASDVAALLVDGRFEPTADLARLGEPDAVLICVPTPLTHHREPDMTYVEGTARSIGKRLRRGQLIVLESTTWPGTTEELVRPILEAESGLRCCADFLLAFSPEREDPGSRTHSLTSIPKIVGGCDAASLEVALALYGEVAERAIAASSPAAAEATKLIENCFRAVNIAFVNETKVLFDRMGLDVWEVIRLASTKPFGFMPFYPGPGLGGHCIPIDPFYLTWKARAFDFSTRFIELAGEINASMPYYVLERLTEAVGRSGKPLPGAKVLVLGVAYKKNVDDMRESPAVELMELLTRRGAQVEYSDPHVPVFPPMREHRFDLRSVRLTPESVAAYDLVLLATNHDAFDYALVRRHARLIVDTRGVYLDPAPNVVKA